MEEQKLRYLFPRASNEFIKANTSSNAEVQYAKSERDQATALDPAIPRKEKGLGRITVRYRLCRVRPLDFENFAGSTKDCTDGLCRCGLIPGDDPTKITLQVEQERVKHFSEERTEIEIIYP